ncbi:ATP synthase subunit beta [Aphelenchoides fujianensis]|nr:ATP synthase subunit beta [Aphelenchoides fujianensis]
MTDPTLSISKLGMKLNEKEDGVIIANLIDYVARLDVLDMRGNTLGVGAAEVIAKSLSRVSSLKRAVFSDMFTGRLKDEIPVVLKSLSDAIIAGKNQLVELDLSDNALGPSAIPGVQEFLSSEPCFSLETLRLINCGLGSAGITVANRMMQCADNARAHGQTFTLREFSAGRNRLEDPGAAAMSAAFKARPYFASLCLFSRFQKLGTLQHIELPQNGIRVNGIVELAKGLGQCAQLEHLNLNDNTFTKNGARAMARALSNIENCLVHVDFGDCLCRAGAVDIMEALVNSHAETLEFIDLTGNELTPDHAAQIIEMTADLPRLRMLNLGLNCFGSQFGDVQAIIEESDAAHYIDLGDEDDDQGSLDGEEDEDE